MLFSLYIRVPIRWLGWHYPEPEQTSVAAEPKVGVSAPIATRGKEAACRCPLPAGTYRWYAGCPQTIRLATP
jgi:hypothetical protein